VVQPGQALTVSLTIDGGNSVDGALFAVGDTLQVFEGPGPFSFQYVVPSGRAGAISMRADTFGPGPENYTATSSLQVNETGPATSLVVQPPSTTLVQIGELFQILVTAKQANGTLTDVTDAEAGTTYTMQSGGSAIASVSSSGVVEANGAGQDTVIVNHGSLQAVIPVKVVITNHSPVIQAVTDVTMPPGASLDVPISVTDTDGDALQIDRMAGPAFAQVVDLGGGAAQLQLRPGVTDVGTFSVAIGATDNGTPPFGTATSARITVCNCGDQGCVVSPGIPEVCNGLDDNCSGQTDEGLGFTSCGLGACLHWTYNCANGEPQECEPGPPSTEVCNGVDDNCNGQTDEGFTDTDGDGIKNCIDPDDDNDGDPDSADCASLNAAVHHGATEGPACNITCSDGLDNDCDGATDTADLAGCPKPPSADYSTGPGTKIAGSYVSTVISDNVREGFREGLQNNKSKLSHVWRFDNILAGSSHELVVEGYRPNNTEGDNFKFGFNTAPGPLFMVIDNAVINASVETMASYPFSGAVSGTIYVLLDDTVGSGGQLDTVYIDCLAIRTLP
jgi:Protein metal binding site.